LYNNTIIISFLLLFFHVVPSSFSQSHTKSIYKLNSVESLCYHKRKVWLQAE
jgi:hypothetical protein